MPWITAVLAALVSRVFTSVFAILGYLLARKIALSTAVIVVFSSLFLGLVVSVKAIVMGARVVMPPVLAQATYFLPGNLPTIIAAIVTIRVSIFVFRWTITNMSVYASHGAGYGSLVR